MAERLKTHQKDADDDCTSYYLISEHAAQASRRVCSSPGLSASSAALAQLAAMLSIKINTPVHLTTSLLT